VNAASADPPPDPFGEHQHMGRRLGLQLLGAPFEFSTDSAALLRLVRHAYQGLPSHALPGAPAVHVRLLLTPAAAGTRTAPAPPRPLAAPGLLGGATDGSALVAVVPEARSALVVVPRNLLRFPYQVRYEMLEFAVYVLAGRTQGLLPLHAACLGRGRDGVLLLGDSGAGKSTLALHGVLSGLSLLAEDSVLLDPKTLRATGVANFLHVQPRSLRLLGERPLARLAGSPVIVRRSGVRKLEIDMRRLPATLAPAPLRIRALVFLSPRMTRKALLQPLEAGQALRRLEASQRYGARQPGWPRFRAHCRQLPAYLLARGSSPQEGVAQLARLLE
jgi:hypothetical protein